MIKVHIMSGPSGSGKSWQAHAYAKVLDSEEKKGVIISTDFYWTGHRGWGFAFSQLQDPETIGKLEIYDFDPTKLPEAHPFTFRKYLDVLGMAVVDAKTDVEEEDFHIIVDNTNIHEGEIAPYYLAAQAYDAEVEILRVEAELDVCIRRNTHGVPEGVIERTHKAFFETREHPWEAGVMIPKQHMPWWTSRSI
jgi:tRNA uridine 5-carbamoylmethylation protein Kti12